MTGTGIVAWIESAWLPKGVSYTFAQTLKGNPIEHPDALEYIASATKSDPEGFQVNFKP